MTKNFANIQITVVENTKRVDIVKKDINIHIGPENIAQRHVMYVLFRRRPLKYQLWPPQQCLK